MKRNRDYVFVCLIFCALLLSSLNLPAAEFSFVIPSDQPPVYYATDVTVDAEGNLYILMFGGYEQLKQHIESS